MSERVFTLAEAREALAKAGLDRWRVDDAGYLERRFKTEGWPTTLLLVNAIGYISEAAWHHPDLEVSYNRVTVRLRTHSANGITEKDVALAARIEEIATWRPDPASGLTGVPRPFVE